MKKLHFALVLAVITMLLCSCSIFNREKKEIAKSLEENAVNKIESVIEMLVKQSNPNNFDYLDFAAKREAKELLKTYLENNPKDKEALAFQDLLTSGKKEQEEKLKDFLSTFKKSVFAEYADYLTMIEMFNVENVNAINVKYFQNKYPKSKYLEPLRFIDALVSGFWDWDKGKPEKFIQDFPESKGTSFLKDMMEFDELEKNMPKLEYADGYYTTSESLKKRIDALEAILYTHSKDSYFYSFVERAKKEYEKQYESALKEEAKRKAQQREWEEQANAINVFKDESFVLGCSEKKIIQFSVDEPEYDYFSIKSNGYGLNIKLFNEVDYWKWEAGNTVNVYYRSDNMKKDQFALYLTPGNYVLYMKPYAPGFFDTDSSRVYLKMKYSAKNHWENIE